MKFVVSSSGLLSHLQAISKVISSKNTLPILDNFLFKIEGQSLVITASDLETTMTTSMELESVEGEGVFALTAKLLLDTLKEFPEQPLTFDINEMNMGMTLRSQNGEFHLTGAPGEEFPEVPELDEAKAFSFELPVSELETGLAKTLFATADDELRPVMNGIYFDLLADELVMVASDAHKLVRYKNLGVKLGADSSFIFPKKPASLLKSILPRVKGSVVVQFDEKNAFFTLDNYNMVCRLVEGRYPSYNSVIPQGNPNKVIVDRVELLNTLKRVSVFSNQASNLVKLHLMENQMEISAQDIDFSISARETLPCQYQGEELSIGFKSVFLVEILSNISASDVVMELADPSRAGIILPLENEENEDVLMLLMPMMLND